jgi:hypothetical protein
MTPVGAPGTVGSVTELEGALATPVPTAFVAAMVNEYVEPAERPVTVQVSAPEVEQVSPLPSVTEYPEMVAPPLLVGAVQLTVAAPVDEVAMAYRGASGVVAGVTADEADEGSDVPAELVAATVNV